MAVPNADEKLLWGRAAGMCSNPECGESLTEILEDGNGYNIGEMAHVIARKPNGPRGVPEGGGDTYQNLILLCPSCHRRIDKAPKGKFPEETLFDWKRKHESNIKELGKEKIFTSKGELSTAVQYLLVENKILWQNLGSRSDAADKDPGSNLHKIWNLRKLDTIVPNNTKIINLIEANRSLLNTRELEVLLTFKMHAKAFEANQYDCLDQYPLFPEEFTRIFV